MWQAFWAVAYKEYLHASRNRKRWERLLTLQVVTLLMVAWIDTSLHDLPLVIVDQDRSAESREVVARLTAAKTFKVVYVTSSTEQARGHIRAGRAKVAVVIPPEYSRLRAEGAGAEILALLDGSDSTTRDQAMGSIEGVVARINADARLVSEAEPTATVTPHPSLLFNPDGDLANFMLPGAFVISIGLAYAMMTATNVSGEREGGNLERLLMTPMDYKGMILGKLAPFFVLGLINALAYVVLLRWGFSVPIRGSLGLLAISMALYLITVLAMGSLIGVGARTSHEARNLLVYLSLPAFMLSGYVFPLSSLPKVLLPISYALPQTHMIEIMRGLFLRGARASDLAPHLLYLVVAPIVFTVGASIRFSRSIMD